MMTNYKEKIKGILPLIIPPVAIMLIMIVSYSMNGLYPFGKGTIAWCDMTQQVIPLLSDLKDMLSGKAGIFLNLQNAGGMSMWGVIFFFIASPFSFLAIFVEKENLVYFVNILTMLKLMTVGFTGALFFRKAMKKLNPMISCSLSVAYAFCGFAMMYYQNSIWLDMMYLFPLLLLSFRSILEKQKMLPYILAMSAMAVVNYYICYMIVLFSLLFMALLCFRYRKEEKYRRTGMLFVIGSGLSALCTAVVWLPSLMQYLASGRTTSVIKTVANAYFLSDFKTTIPLLLATVSAFVICAVCLCDGKSRSKKLNTYLIMLFLLIVPIVVEPVNLMWHTGSYMSFPCRFSFMTIFILLICTGICLSDDSVSVKALRKSGDSYLVFVICLAMTFGVFYLVNDIIYDNQDRISHFTGSLWGSTDSFQLIFKLAVLVGAAMGIIFMFHKKGLMSRELFSIFLAVFVIIESYGNLQIYPAYPNYQNSERAEPYVQSMKLADKIEDDDFYRVKSDSKLFEVNNLGAMGYRSMSHYTSLTDKDYMFAMKKLGYSSYWMEVGSHQGTELTDALLSVKYNIVNLENADDNIAYRNNEYAIEKLDNTIGFGFVTDKDLSAVNTLKNIQRSKTQELIYDTLFAENENDKLVTEYDPSSTNNVVISNKSDKYIITQKDPEKTSTIIYSIPVTEKKTLYFDCFDALSNSVNEPINNSFSVSVNDELIQENYPSTSSNGLLRLGEFEKELVKVTIEVNNDVECVSYGVFGINNQKVEKAVQNAKSANLNETGGKITGSYNAVKGEKCVVSVPYTENFTVKINGKAVNYSKTLDDFIVFNLNEGNNDIEITAVANGFTAGLIISIVGTALTVAAVLLRKKVKFSDNICRIFNICVIGLGVAVLLVIYIAPCIINALYYQQITV